ncbi:MAG: restriction endonuclease [Acidiferrobacteraceae bacterium]
MNELTLHPNVYATGHSKGLIHILERVWVREHTPGDGTLFVISGFGNYNGGVRFFETFRQHKARGGDIVAIFAGSTSARLTSKQVVKEMLDCGTEVHIVNRKRLLHAKCYGALSSRGDSLVVTSGNFTGPGMSQNVEMSVLLDQASTAAMKFSWRDLIDNMLAQKWAFYQPTLVDLATPAWQLLYDEQASDITLDDTDEVTLLLRLSHADTARINAAKETAAAKGTQYFWLSKDCYDFFPSLTIRNARGHKATYSCIVTMNYIDLDVVDRTCRVTFEAENNLDFRLGTGPLRYTGLAAAGDLAAISRVGETEYELRLYRQGSREYATLTPYAVNFIGHQGKQYGYMPNAEFNAAIGAQVGVRARPH